VRLPVVPMRTYKQSFQFSGLAIKNARQRLQGPLRDLLVAAMGQLIRAPSCCPRREQRRAVRHLRPPGRELCFRREQKAHAGKGAVIGVYFLPEALAEAQGDVQRGAHFEQCQRALLILKRRMEANAARPGVRLQQWQRHRNDGPAGLESCAAIFSINLDRHCSGLPAHLAGQAAQAKFSVSVIAFGPQAVHNLVVAADHAKTHLASDLLVRLHARHKRAHADAVGPGGMEALDIAERPPFGMLKRCAVMDARKEIGERPVGRTRLIHQVHDALYFGKEVAGMEPALPVAPHITFHLGQPQPAPFGQLPYLRRPPMYELRSQLHRCLQAGRVQRMDTAADPLTRLQHNNRHTRAGEFARRRQSRYSRADDDDPLGHAASSTKCRQLGPRPRPRLIRCACRSRGVRFAWLARSTSAKYDSTAMTSQPLPKPKLREKAQLMSASEIERTLVRLAHEIIEKNNG